MTEKPAGATNAVGQTSDGADAPIAADAMVDTGGAAVDPAEALAKEAAEARDRWMRALAEMENLRRRMERALKALDAGIRDKADAGVKALLDGVELTERELLKAMEKHGIARIEPEGQKFDPNLHQAMFEVPDPSVPAGTVVRIVQPGYTIGGRVLRPALVAIAKGGPKAGPGEAPANDNTDSA